MNEDYELTGHDRYKKQVRMTGSRSYKKTFQRKILLFAGNDQSNQTHV